MTKKNRASEEASKNAVHLQVTSYVLIVKNLVFKKMEAMKMENEKMVQNIVLDMENYASGDYFLHNGELFPIDEENFASKVDCEIRKEDTLCGEYTYYVMPDGEEILEDNIESTSLYDYFNDFLDVDYIVDSTKEYKGARIMVTCGGPNIFIDSYRGIVELFWWTEHASAEIPADLCDEINDIFRDYYYC